MVPLAVPPEHFRRADIRADLGVANPASSLARAIPRVRSQDLATRPERFQVPVLRMASFQVRAARTASFQAPVTLPVHSPVPAIPPVHFRVPAIPPVHSRVPAIPPAHSRARATRPRRERLPEDVEAQPDCNWIVWMAPVDLKGFPVALPEPDQVERVDRAVVIRRHRVSPKARLKTP